METPTKNVFTVCFPYSMCNDQTGIYKIFIGEPYILFDEEMIARIPCKMLDATQMVRALSLFW